MLKPFQWGLYNKVIDGTNYGIFNFPISFPNATYGIWQCALMEDPSVYVYPTALYIIDNSSFKLSGKDMKSVIASVIIIGY